MNEMIEREKELITSGKDTSATCEISVCEHMCEFGCVCVRLVLIYWQTNTCAIPEDCETYANDEQWTVNNSTRNNRMRKHRKGEREEFHINMQRQIVGSTAKYDEKHKQIQKPTERERGIEGIWKITPKRECRWMSVFDLTHIGSDGLNMRWMSNVIGFHSYIAITNQTEYASTGLY